MSNKLSVFIVASSPEYVAMFKNEGWNIAPSIEEADLVQFTGGSDVFPRLYGEPPHRTTSYNEGRDEKEKQIYELAQELGIPCAGICRGGQFLNVMNHGRMFQDVDNHTRQHKARVLGMTDPIDEVEINATTILHSIKFRMRLKA